MALMALIAVDVPGLNRERFLIEILNIYTCVTVISILL